MMSGLATLSVLAMAFGLALAAFSVWVGPSGAQNDSDYRRKLITDEGGKHPVHGTYEQESDRLIAELVFWEERRDFGVKLYGGAFLAVLIFSTLARSAQTGVSRGSRKAGSGQLVAALLLVILPIAGFIVYVAGDRPGASSDETMGDSTSSAREENLSALWTQLKALDPDDREAVTAAGSSIDAAVSTSLSTREAEALKALKAELQELRDAHDSTLSASFALSGAKKRSEEVNVRSFIIGRRFDTQIGSGWGMYEALDTRSLVKVVVIVPEDEVGTASERANQSTKLTVWDEGEELYYTHAGTSQFLQTYRFEPAGVPSKEDLEQLEQSVTEARQALDEARRQWKTTVAEVLHRN